MYPHTAPKIPIGILMKKIQRQEAALRINPPSTGPSTPPVAQVIPLMPSARPRSLGGNTSVRMATLLTTIIAAPDPWIRREMINITALLERPQASEPTVKTTNPRLYILTRPIKSATRPKVRRNTVLISR